MSCLNRFEWARAESVKDHMEIPLRDKRLLGGTGLENPFQESKNLGVFTHFVAVDLVQGDREHGPVNTDGAVLSPQVI